MEITSIVFVINNCSNYDMLGFRTIGDCNSQKLSRGERTGANPVHTIWRLLSRSNLVFVVRGLRLKRRHHPLT